MSRRRSNTIDKSRKELQKECAEATDKLAQYHHKIQRLKNRLRYYTKGDGRKQTYRLITREAEVERTDTTIELPDIPKLPMSQRFVLEKAATGLYLSGHPMDEYRELAEQAGAMPIRQVSEILSDSNRSSNSGVRLACVISSVQRCITKKATEWLLSR